MAYSELIKSFARIRGYMREFYVYGFRHRTEIHAKSARSYDNERRRIESWLGDYMYFGQDSDGKRMYLSVDSRTVPNNPLYKAFKTKSFTDNDVMLHFYLMNLLPEEEGYTIREVLRELEDVYLSDFDREPFDESTIRKKLNEYEQLGLVEKRRRGRETLYVKKKDGVNLESWKEAITFYSETAPLGVVGSYLLDKYDETPKYYRFKHHYILRALDSEILYSLLEAISEHRRVELTMHKAKATINLVPFKIYISTQYGRQHLLAWIPKEKYFHMYRLDHILHVKTQDIVLGSEWDFAHSQLKAFTSHLWGVAVNGKCCLEHLEFEIYVGEYEQFIVDRLEREKRCGSVIQIGEHRYRFLADVYSAREMLPWVRTFIGRILRFECSNPKVQKRFFDDFEKMNVLYGIKDQEENRD